MGALQPQGSLTTGLFIRFFLAQEDGGFTRVELPLERSCRSEVADANRLWLQNVLLFVSQMTSLPVVPT